jgi:hypothetical protein
MLHPRWVSARKKLDTIESIIRICCALRAESRSCRGRYSSDSSNGRRYVAALGGTLELVAKFGDTVITLAGAEENPRD